MMTLGRKCSQQEEVRGSPVLTTKSRIHQHLPSVTHPFISMKTSAAQKALHILDTLLHTSKTSTVSALGSTSNLCHLYLKELVKAVIKNTQINLQQKLMQHANLKRAVQEIHQLVTADLAVIPEEWGPDHFGLVWICQEQCDLLSKVWFLWTLMDNWTLHLILLQSQSIFTL